MSRLHAGRSDLQLYVDGRLKDKSITYTTARQWADASVFWTGPSFFVFVLGLPHVTLIELRLSLISYQDYHMLLLTLAGYATAGTHVLQLRSPTANAWG